MNEEDAKILLKLKQVPRNQRTAFWLAGKQDVSLTQARNKLKILAAQGYLQTHIGKNRNVYYNPTQLGYEKAYWALYPKEMKEKQEEIKNGRTDKEV